MLKDNEIQINIGRAVGGDFMKIIHVPTGIYRLKNPPLGSGAEQHRIKKQFLQEIEEELREKGLTEYII